MTVLQALLVIVLASMSLATQARPDVPEALRITEEQREELASLIRDGVSREDARKQVLTEEQLEALSGKQSRKGREKARGRLLDELDLTEEQRKEIEEIRAAGGGRGEVHAVLTEEQREALQNMKRERMGRHGENGSRRPKGEPRGAEAATTAEGTSSD